MSSKINKHDVDETIITEDKMLTKTSQLTNDSDFATNASVDTKLLDKAPSYAYGTTDLTAGTSELETGTLYFMYE